MRRLRRVAGVFVVVMSAAFDALALEVGLEARGCASISHERVRELATLELTTRVVAPRAAEPPGALVLVSCTGEQVSIRVTDEMTGKVVLRSFILEDAEPDVRARAVALAVAELVLTSWLELMLPQPADPKGSATAHTEDRREASAIVRRRTNGGPHVDGVFAFGEVGGTSRAKPWTRGVGLRLSLVLSEPTLALDADLSATTASDRSALGEVYVQTWSFAARPSLRLRRGAWLGTLGVGARVGLARIEGSPADVSASRGRSLIGAWGGPLVHANLGLQFSPVALRLGGEAGYALRGISGSVQGSDRGGVQGPWLLVSLGFGWGA